MNKLQKMVIELLDDRFHELNWVSVEIDIAWKKSNNIIWRYAFKTDEDFEVTVLQND